MITIEKVNALVDAASGRVALFTSEVHECKKEQSAIWKKRKAAEEALTRAKGELEAHLSTLEAIKGMDDDGDDS